MYWNGSGTGNVGTTTGTNMQGYDTKYSQDAGTGNSGNLQPYICVYMWKRVS